jgi:hypothetical protein
MGAEEPAGQTAGTDIAEEVLALNARYYGSRYASMSRTVWQYKPCAVRKETPMRQGVQHVLTLIMGLVFIAGSVAGCADFAGTARQPPRAATGAAAGDAGGTSAGGLLSRGGSRTAGQ